MHILIDVQGLQSESKVRGIGRSTLAMSRAIIKNKGDHRVSILINGMYTAHNVAEVKKQFLDVLPLDEMFVFSGLGPVEYRDTSNYGRSSAAKNSRDIAIANINPDIVYVISFFEGYTDNYIVSIPSEKVMWKTVCVCHDLIPLLNEDLYLGDPKYREFYMDKLYEFKQADSIFAISDSAKNEVVKYAGISSEKILNISSAVTDEFKMINYSSDEIGFLRSKYQLPNEFILSLAMIEPRKNIEALIHAYSLLPQELQNRYPLVLAYSVRKKELDRIIVLAEGYGLKREQLIFTGFLPDNDLIALYNICKLFVFPSLHEGFGLPPLEAMSCGAATISSNATSLSEVIGWDDAMFDPTNVEDICRAIQRALTDDVFYEKLKKHSLSQSAKFSWDKTALTAISGFAKLLEKKEEKVISPEALFSSKIDEIAQDESLSEVDRLGVAWAIARNSFKQLNRKLVVDISVLVQHDAKTGIQRVSRSILSEFLKLGLQSYDVSAVYYTPGEGYRYANKYLSSHFDGAFGEKDDFVLFSKDDILIATDLTAHLFPEIVPEINNIRLSGTSVCFVVHDILPLRHPEWSIEGIQRDFPIWLSCLAENADKLICVSSSVAEDVKAWISEHTETLNVNPLLEVSNFHLGADLAAGVPTTGLPKNADELLQKMVAEPSFIMVGTMEPRKGHAQTLAAFEQLWQQGKNYNLFIVGKQGWNVEALCDSLRKHEQRDRKLFWLQDISDEFLEELYSHSRALIFSSLGEGFGLPLIEAAQKGLPVIIRDIPVFKEIAGEHAFYFSGEAPSDIASAIDKWLVLYEKEIHPRSENIKWLTWKQSAELLLEKLPLINTPANSL